MEQVRKEGDAAVRQLTEKFDKVKLDDICIPVQVRSSCSSTQGVSWYAIHFMQCAVGCFCTCAMTACWCQGRSAIAACTASHV